MRAKIAVKGILFDKHRSRILLVQRSGDDPTGPGTWESAGGCMERGETPEDALRREIREEVGIADITIRGLAYVSMLDGDDPCLIIVYVCESPTESVRLSAEHRSFRWADQEACKALLPQPIMDDFNRNGIFDLFSNGTD